MIVKKNYSKLVLASLCLLCNLAYAQLQPACPNANFAQGGFNNWSAFTGNLVSASQPGPPVVNAVWDPFQVSGVISGRHTILSTPGFDPYTCGGLPILPPGVFVVARLGDNNTGSQTEAVRYNMTVSIDNSLLIYKYAAVLEDGGHPAESQPRMKINVRDQSGNIIGGPCGVYDVYSGQAGQNFQVCGAVSWLPWSTAALDLSAFIGQTIQVEFVTQDCDQSGHFGYAYLTMSCQPLKLTVQYCQGTNAATLTAPTGFSSYLWNTGATTPSITIPSPATGTTYSCQLTTLTNNGSCSVSVDVEVEPTIVLPDYTYTQNCGQLNVQFTNTSTVNNNVIVANLWNFGDGTTSTQSSPNHTYATPGVYNVRLVSYETTGCRDTMIKQVTVKSIPTADFTVPSTCIFAPVTASNTSTDLINQTMTYSWDFGDGTPLETTANPTHIYQTAGTFTITLIAMNQDSCTHTRVRNITVNPLPPVEAGIDQQLCPYTPMTLNGSGAVSYTWNNGATNGTPFIPSVDGKYIVNGTDANGCINKDSLMVTFLPAPVVSAGADVTVSKYFGYIYRNRSGYNLYLG